MNQSNHVLILGANGMLGKIMSEVFENEGILVSKITRSFYDPCVHQISHLHSLWKNPPQLIVNCIAQNKLYSIETMLQVNAIFPKQLSYFCDQLGIKLIHISTNGVFLGEKGDYLETNVPNTNETYGISKLLGENASESMVIRTSIIGFEKNTEKKYLLEWVLNNANKQINGYNNHFWNGLTTLHLSEFIVFVYKNNLYQKGLFHIHSPNKISKYELVNKINKCFDLNIKIISLAHNQADDKSLSSCKNTYQSFFFKEIEEQLSDLKTFKIAQNEIGS